MKTYGYARISTPKQLIDRQIKNIKGYHKKIDMIIEETYTGTSQDRPKWNKLYEILKPGDTIIFDSVSRMSRNAVEGFKMYQDLFNKNINLIFLKEPHINTETYKKALKSKVPETGDKIDYIIDGVNKYLMALAEEQIKLAFLQSQKEVDDLRQRTVEGIINAKLRGKQVGRSKGISVDPLKKAPIKKIIFNKSKDFKGNLNDAEVLAVLSSSTVRIKRSNSDELEIPATLSKNTYYKYKKELFNELS